MSETMMALGNYRFSVNAAAYQELKKSQSYRWQAQERLLRRPAKQFVGIGDETLDLSGVIYPHYLGGLKQLDSLRTQAGRGEPLLLVDGLGFVWGQWIVNKIDEDQSYFLGNGIPMKISFQLHLSCYGADDE